MQAQADAAQNRRRQVADTLKELEQRQKAREKVTMRLRLQRAGLDITPRSFWIVRAWLRRRSSALCIWLSAPNLPIIVPLLAAFVGAFGLPRWFVARLTKRRQNKFIDEFANAIDVIVRGVKSGLPLPRVPWHHRPRVAAAARRRVQRAGRAAARRRPAGRSASSA